MSITEPELVTLIKNRLAPAPLEMELTDAQVYACIDYAKRWYVTNAGVRVLIPLYIVEGTIEYQLPSEIVDVTDVHFESNQLPAVAWDWEFVGISGIPVNYNFLWPGTMDYSGLVQMLQRLEEGKRIVGSEKSWRYRQQDRILEVYPATSKSGKAIIEAISAAVDINTLPYDEQWLVIRWSVADCKEVLGRLRSKHSGIPGPGGDQQLDGERLLEEAKEEKERLQEEIRNRRVPIGFITG